MDTLFLKFQPALLIPSQFFSFSTRLLSVFFHSDLTRFKTRGDSVGVYGLISLSGVWA